jgi:hypothetical protein
MTFLELQNQVLEACGHTTATSSAPRTRVKRSLNIWQRKILNRPGANVLLRDSEASFDSVASQHTYGLGLPMGRLLGISCDAYEATLALESRAWLRRVDPGLTAAGDPASVYVPKGWFPVQQHPANASSVFAKSTSAADTTQVVDWEFIVSGPDRVAGNTTLNGTTAVQLGTASTVIEVVKLSLRTAGAGTITIHEDSGTGTQLASFLAGAQSRQFLHVQLYPTPSSAITYRIDYTRVLQDMVQDTDVPVLSYDFQYLLSLGAEYDELKKLSDDRATMAYQELDRELRSLNAYLWDLPDDTEGARPARSRLGGMYPAGS